MEWKLMVAEEYRPCPFVVHGGGKKEGQEQDHRMMIFCT
jgi:hypothetical protein